MKQQAQSLNTYFWNVGNDIADIRLLAEGAVALYENDPEVEAQQSELDELKTVRYWVRKVIPDALPLQQKAASLLSMKQWRLPTAKMICQGC